MDETENIYWLLTAKGVCMKMAEILESQPDTTTLMESLRPRDVCKLLDNRRDRVPPQTALSWLLWGEEKYASCLTPANKSGILQLAAKYESRAFHRADGTLEAQRPYNYLAT